MKIEDIQELWDKDCIIDQTELGQASIEIPKLQNKYYKIYLAERFRLHKLNSELKELRLEKFEFYTQGPTQAQFDRGWKLPAAGKILKNEVQTYLDSDKDVIQHTLKIAAQQEKVDFLKYIIDSLNSRGWNIKNAIEDMKFKNGGY